MTTTGTPTTSIPAASGQAHKDGAKKPLLFLKEAQIFWVTLGVNAVFDFALLLAAYCFGIVSGYEGKATFNGSRLGAAVKYLFGGTDQLLAFIGILALIGLALFGAYKLSKNGHHKWVLGMIVAAFVIGGLTFSRLAVGANMVPLLVFVAFVAVQAWCTTAFLRIREKANH